MFASPVSTEQLSFITSAWISGLVWRRTRTKFALTSSVVPAKPVNDRKERTASVEFFIISL